MDTRTVAALVQGDFSFVLIAGYVFEQYVFNYGGEESQTCTMVQPIRVCVMSVVSVVFGGLHDSSHNSTLHGSTSIDGLRYMNENQGSTSINVDVRRGTAHNHRLH